MIHIMMCYITFYYYVYNIFYIVENMQLAIVILMVSCYYSAGLL